jgi:lactaldehyde dehydrogenase/glycolaldehyde dehydrogenase
MKKYRIFIDGGFVDSESKEVITVVNPATDEIVSEVPNCNRADVIRAIESCKKAQKEWKKTTSIERAGYLKRLAKEVMNNADYLGRSVCEEQGKILPDAIGAVRWGAGVMEYHAEWARRMEGEVTSCDLPSENLIIYKEPMGIVACILPWNFPLGILMRKLAPALITGSTVILKPSSETPGSALEFAKIVEKVGIPNGVVNIVTGKGSKVGRELCTNPEIRMIAMTGSTEIGQEIMRLAATNLTRVSLELGGKAPAIVMKDCDLELAVKSVIGQKIFNAGQICSGVERVYVQQEVADKFIKRVSEGMRSVTFGNGAVEPCPMMGSIINHEAVNSIHRDVEKAVKQGAKIVVGGNIPTEKGSFYEATVLVNCSQDMDIMHKEIFGPVMPIAVFKDEQEALELANDCEYGLTSTLYTKSLQTEMLFANNIEFGELFVNRPQGEEYHGYHAGWKKSGIGGDDGRHGMEEFLQTRAVYVRY